MDPALLPLGFAATLISITVYVLIKKTSISFTRRGVDNNQLLSLVSSLGDGIIYLNSKLDLLVVNPTALKLLGLSSRPASLDTILVALGTRVNLKYSISQSLQAKAVIKLNEFAINNFIIQAEIEPVFDTELGEMGAVVVLHDITSQKQLEKLHDEFTAMMVHELRTPLTTTLYSTNMLLTDFDKLKPSDFKSQIQTIQSTTSHLLSLVTDILDIAKIEAGRFQIVKAPNDLNELITEKIDQLQPLAEQKHLSIKLQLQPSLPHLSFDPNRISQVIDNLTSNAIKYTEAGEIIISSKLNGSEVEVSIQDTGQGIAPEDLPKLFSKFTQLGKGRSGDKPGTGLGLVIAKGIVETHGGRIWGVSSGQGQGSTFTFTLPATPTFS